MVNLLVSFSGGETSAYMAQWLWKNKKDQYNIHFVFANTGQENEQTLQFVRDCEHYFGFPITWVEAEVFHNQRKGTGYKIVKYKSASRNGEPFEEVIKKYGIPNRAYPHCSRELKMAPIHAYVKSFLKWNNYYTAIGIRIDEIDRIAKDRIIRKLIYPLVSDQKMTKQKINFWWSQQSFRLNLKGYQGNCITCWKKSDKKLYQIAKESVFNFNFMATMEAKYGNYTPVSRTPNTNRYTFFRQNRSAIDIINESKKWKGSIIDDSELTESCDLFTDCGIDN